MKKTIYLAGPMLGFSAEEMNNWRNITISLLEHKYNLINPARRIYEQCDFRFIVEQDKYEIDQSDILLVNHLIPSDGTAMEMLYAFDRKKEIYTVVHDKPFSPWIEYHSKILFRNFNDAINHLINIPNEGEILCIKK
jgi:nucleoside 2-deoxyribosyltransferase